MITFDKACWGKQIGIVGDLQELVLHGYAQYCNVTRGRLLQVVGHIIHKSALVSPEPGFRFYSLGPHTKRY